QSRSRIEYLQRIGAWQEMARRLAHEIKNPLTPIQLAVQECHRKYSGEDPRFRKLMDTTLEIVEEEVATLRRLLGDFSNIARLPHAELVRADIGSFLGECKDSIGHMGDETTQVAADGKGEPAKGGKVEVVWEKPPPDLEANIDKQMLRRVM